MAHFQLPMQRRPYSTVIGGTRPFLSGTAGDEAIVIEMGKRVTLELVGVTGARPRSPSSPWPASSRK